MIVRAVCNRFARPIATSGFFDSEPSEASEVDASQKDFSVRELRNGYSASDAYRLHSEWNLDQFLDAGEAGAYSYLNLPESLSHAVVRRDGHVSVLESRPNPAIGATSLKDEDKDHRCSAPAVWNGPIDPGRKGKG